MNNELSKNIKFWIGSSGYEQGKRGNLCCCTYGNMAIIFNHDTGITYQEQILGGTCPAFAGLAMLRTTSGLNKPCAAELAGGEIEDNNKKLKRLAARQIAFDRQIINYRDRQPIVIVCAGIAESAMLCAVL